ncbi:MAG: HNH endonuclease [Candidatus Omnitrophota bacterium]
MEEEFNTNSGEQQTRSIEPKIANPNQRRGAEQHSLELRYEVLERFLFDGWTHRELQKKVLQIPAPKHGGGFEAMYILHCFGFGGDDTRGLLARVKSYDDFQKLIRFQLSTFSPEQQDAVRQVWRRHLGSMKEEEVIAVQTSSNDKTNSDEDWSDSEIKESVKAYLWMLGCEKNGKSYNKSAVNKSLREGVLSKRTHGSIEYRMENISATLAELCLPWIEGYKPHGNVGSGVKKKIVKVLDELGVVSAEDYSPTNKLEVLDERSRRLLKIDFVGEPAGNISPIKTETVSYQYVRDPLVKAWILRNAIGHCELCKSPAPFVMPDGIPYLEIHHVKPLSEDGHDTINNAVALCPNCHKKCHLSKDKKEAAEALYNNIRRLQRTSE